jgi:hypothetical protein
MKPTLGFVASLLVSAAIAAALFTAFPGVFRVRPLY